MRILPFDKGKRKQENQRALDSQSLRRRMIDTLQHFTILRS